MTSVLDQMDAMSEDDIFDDELSDAMGKSKISTSNEHHLILGDCLEKMNELEPESIDCIISDGPYGSTTNIWDKELDLENRWEIIFVIFQ